MQTNATKLFTESHIGMTPSTSSRHWQSAPPTNHATNRTRKSAVIPLVNFSNRKLPVRVRPPLGRWNWQWVWHRGRRTSEAWPAPGCRWSVTAPTHRRPRRCRRPPPSLASRATRWSTWTPATTTTTTTTTPPRPSESHSAWKHSPRSSTGTSAAGPSRAGAGAGTEPDAPAPASSAWTCPPGGHCPGSGPC